MLNPTTDLSALAEQLCRIEHKLDLIVRFLATENGSFELAKLSQGVDPITQEPVTYYMDILKRHVVRKSSDGTGLIPPSNILFTPPDPTKQAPGTNNGGSENGNG